MLHIFFFFNDTATTEIYTLSLHDALPILRHLSSRQLASNRKHRGAPTPVQGPVARTAIRVISDKTLTRNASCSSAVRSCFSSARPNEQHAPSLTASRPISPPSITQHSPSRHYT